MPNKDNKENLNIIQQITEIIEACSNKTVLRLLLSIEKELHYIPNVALELVADASKKTINDVWNTACFYTNFRFTKPNNQILDICWGPSCHINGAQEVMKKAFDILEMDSEGESEKLDFTLKMNTCLGACAHAPVVAVNHKLKGKMTPLKIAEFIESFPPPKERQK